MHIKTLPTHLFTDESKYTYRKTLLFTNKHTHRYLMLVFIMHIAFLFGCNTPHTETGDTINIPLQSALESPFVKFEDVIDTMKFIQLEYNERSIIGSINQLRIYKGDIYLIDGIQNTVYKFSEAGAFQFVLQKGKGPGELINPQWITINEKTDELYVLDNSKKALLTYNLSGVFIKKIPLKFAARSFEFINNYENIFYYSSFLNTPIIEEGGNSFNAFVSDLKGNIISKYFPFDKNAEVYNFLGIKDVYSNLGNKQYFFSQFKDHIYYIDGENLVSACFLDFGNNNQEKSQKYFSKMAKNKIHDFDLINKEKTSSNIYMLRTHKQTKDHFFIACTYNKSSLPLFIDKNNMEVRKIDFDESILPYYPYFSNDEYFISVLNQLKIAENMDYFKNINNLGNILNNQPIDSNPIIVFYKLKSFSDED